MRGPKNYIYGKHAVLEAILNAPQIVKKIYISSDFRDEEVKKIISRSNISVNVLRSSREADNVLGRDAVHQGIFCQVSLDSLMIPFERFVKDLDLSKNPSLALLDELSDPHNVGAIIRSAAAFGVSGVLIPEHNQAPVTGTVVKTSAGMAFRIPLVSIGNINHTIRSLKDEGFNVYGLEMEGAKEVSKAEFSRPSLFIIGNEDKGIRMKTRELCDALIQIPMNKRCESLNASVSAAIVFYEWSTKHKEAILG